MWDVYNSYVGRTIWLAPNTRLIEGKKKKLPSHILNMKKKKWVKERKKKRERERERKKKRNKERKEKGGEGGRRKEK
jgi:hypothetical protein